jgi:very-short-patch-repair endonuclease
MRKETIKERARELRNNSTLSEVLLWNQLKGRKMYGYQFLRQKPIGNYITDFYCFKLKLIVEIDGSSHDEKETYDSQRQTFLEKLGYTVLRFNDLDVKKDMQNVLRVIADYIENLNDKLEE